MTIALTPEQINEFIAKAVMDSAIGVHVQTAVKNQIQKLCTSYDNPFDAVIRSEVCKLIESEIITTYRPLLEERMKKALADHMTDEVVAKIIGAAIDKLNRNY